MDDFSAAIAAAMRDAGGKGIGSLGEKTLHLALKYYFAPDPLCHERPLGGYVADAVTEDGVIEVQTRGLNRLVPKLTALLPLCPVTVVLPIAEDKILVRVDEFGTVLSERRSPKHETIFSAMREIYALRELITNDNLRICVVSLMLREYSAETGKRRRLKLDREPVTLRELWMLESPADFAALLPPLPAVFTAAELGKILHIETDIARRMVNLYARLGLTREAGQRGRTKLWRCTEMVSNAMRG